MPPAPIVRMSSLRLTRASTWTFEGSHPRRHLAPRRGLRRLRGDPSATRLGMETRVCPRTGLLAVLDLMHARNRTYRSRRGLGVRRGRER